MTGASTNPKKIQFQKGLNSKSWFKDFRLFPPPWKKFLHSGLFQNLFHNITTYPYNVFRRWVVVFLGDFVGRSVCPSIGLYLSSKNFEN